MSFTYTHTCHRQPEYKKKTETILKINRKPEILPNDNKLLLENIRRQMSIRWIHIIISSFDE